MLYRYTVLTLIVLAGCSGKVTDDGNRSSDRVLAEEGADLCASICERIIECDVMGGSCDCPSNSDCECSRGSYSQAECEFDCGESVDEIVQAGPACSELALDGLQCFAGEATCSTLSGAPRRCMDLLEAASDCAYDASDSLGCHEGWGSAGTDSSGAPPPIGSLACTEGCSGRHDYEVSCVHAEVGFDCTCLMDGQAVGRFSTDTCGGNFDECGFGDVRTSSPPEE